MFFVQKVQKSVNVQNNIHACERARGGERACIPRFSAAADASAAAFGRQWTPSFSQMTSRARVYRGPFAKCRPWSRSHSRRTCGGVRKDAHQLMRVPPPRPDPASTEIPAHLYAFLGVRAHAFDALSSLRVCINTTRVSSNGTNMSNLSELTAAEIKNRSMLSVIR
jgi:hypothetical protein